MDLVPLFGVLFASPFAAVAAAGGAAAIPIIIHLLNRKRYVVVNWAAMRFLLAAQKKNVRRLKLEQWLLLAVRTMLVVMLIVAMAAVMPWMEPLWQRLFPGGALASPSQGRTHRIIVIDASFTMATRRTDDRSRFDVAKEQAKAILEKSAPGDGFSVILMGSPAQVIVPGPADDRDKVAREIDQLKMPHGSADVVGALHAAAELVSKSKVLGKHPRREVYFISDLRKSDWTLPGPSNKSPDAPTPAVTGATDAWTRLLDNASVVAVDVAGRDLDNVSVSSLTIGDPLPLINTDLPVSATIHNYGLQARTELPVTLFLYRVGDRGQPIQLEQKLVNVPPHAAITVNFALEKQNRFRQPGQYVLQVRTGGDDLRLDDSRSLAVTVRDTIPVAVVNGKPSADPLDRASGFLTKALNPYPEAERSPECPADVRVLNPREFQDAGLGDLFRPEAPTEVVFLCDLATIGGSEAARLEAHLKRGGSVVIGLGPNAAKNIDAYNRVLFNDGKGILPAPLVGVRRAGEGEYFTLVADEESFKQPPLSRFKSERERSSFSTPRFGRYVRLDLPPNGPARRIFNFLPSDRGAKAEPLDAAVIEWPKHRGRVVVFTSSLNADWTEWPRALSFAPFIQELLRFAVSGATRQTIQAGEPYEEYVPAPFVGLSAAIAHEAGMSLEPIPVVSQDEAGLVRLPTADRSGVHRVTIGGQHEALFAVNVPVLSPTGGAESDLRRLNLSDFKSAAPDADIQVLGDISEVHRNPTADSGANDDLTLVEQRGPAVARVLLIVVVVLLLVETILAWQFGSARAGSASDPMRVRPVRWLTPLWILPMVICAAVFGIVVHAAATGEFLGFLPTSVRRQIEQSVGVPEAAPGEGTRWRLESMSYVTGDLSPDRWLIAGLLVLSGIFVWQIYRRERPGQTAAGPLTGSRNPLVRLGTLRFGLLLLALTVLLPQVKLAFEREGWPDVVVAIDDSRSMSVVDTFQDPETRAKADELKAKWSTIAAPRVRKLEERANEIRRDVINETTAVDTARLREELAQIEARLLDLRTPHRLNLIKALLASGDGDWLRALLKQRQMRVHIYRVSGQATQMADLNDPEQCQRMLDELIDVMPTDDSSQLGNDVSSILKTFRGGSLNAIVMFTDGVTTRGEDLPSAARSAARAGVSLHLIGVGDAAEPPDLILADLRAEEVIHVNDRLVIEAKVSSQGPGMPDSVPVTLSEMRNGQQVELERQVVRLDRQGKPVKIRFVHQPKEAGEKTFIVEFPKSARPAEDVEPGNDRIEHHVFVAEAKRLRVLIVDGYPRYDFRYIKALLERESDAVRGNKSIDVDAYLLSADPEHPKQDRNSINRFPTSEELRKYDVVILGDVDPRKLARPDIAIDSLVKFVKEQGGGLLVMAGEHAMPHAYRDTALADVLPVICEGPPSAPAGDTLKEPFRPRLTAAGQSHPLFRFSAEEADNNEIWNRLPSLYWYARGYRRKLSAEVLAVHPDRPVDPAPGTAAREENYPLILQQFVGSGRVLFMGFDDTWRWRFRQDEVRFNQFWLQAVQVLARGRVGRTEVRTDRKTYRRDEAVRISVRFPDDAPPPAGPVKVTVERHPPRGGGAAKSEVEQQTIQLAPREGTRATFEALVTRTPEGNYSFTLSTPLPSGSPPRAEARILPPPGEMDRIQLNEQDLQRAARESRGTYYPLHRADSLPDELPSGPRVALDQPCEPISIWNHPLMLSLVLSLLTAEWLMRKKWRLL